MRGIFFRFFLKHPKNFEYFISKNLEFFFEKNCKEVNSPSKKYFFKKKLKTIFGIIFLKNF